jgi:Protein of unknown function (DUF4089)
VEGLKAGRRGDSVATPPEFGAEYLGVVQANAALLGLTITAEQRPGVLMYFALAAQMAELVDGLPLTAADEAANVFRPVPPQVDE